MYLLANTHINACIYNHRTDTQTPHALGFMYVSSISVYMFNECSTRCNTPLCRDDEKTCDLKLHNTCYDNVKWFPVRRMCLVKNEHGVTAPSTSRILNTNKCLQDWKSNTIIIVRINYKQWIGKTLSNSHEPRYRVTTLTQTNVNLQSESTRRFQCNIFKSTLLKCLSGLFYLFILNLC